MIDDTFNPTHELRGPHGETLRVEWVATDDGRGAALYTAHETRTGACADWEYHEGRGLLFQGRGCAGWSWHAIVDHETLKDARYLCATCGANFRRPGVYRHNLSVRGTCPDCGATW